MNKLPQVTPELIDYLEQIYPDQAPSLQMSDREVWVSVGTAEVVRHLRALFDQQNETVLEG